MSCTKFAIILTVTVIVNCVQTGNRSSEAQQNSTHGQYKSLFGNVINAPFDFVKNAVSLSAKIAVTAPENSTEKSVNASLIASTITIGNWRNIHITNGLPAIQQDYSYVVHILQGNDASNKLCGGVIVSKQHILTVAHCFDGQKKNQEFYVLTSMFRRPLKVLKIIKHECYNSETMFDDIAVLKLQNEFDNKIDTISLPESGEYNSEKAGKGIVLGTDSKSKNLVYLNVSVLPVTECSEHHKSINSNQICVGNTEINSCTAESGFPLIQSVEKRNILTGLASYTHEDCAKASSVYTRVDKYLNFINGELNGEKFIARCYDNIAY